jgi:hypothetical protein
MLLVQLHFPYYNLPSLRTDCILRTTSDDANLKSHKPRSRRSVVIHHVLSNRNKLNKAHTTQRDRNCTELKKKNENSMKIKQKRNNDKYWRLA